MESVLLVGTGGIFGSITRYALGKFISKHFDGAFPWGTFIINITGAFFLGFLTAININKEISLLLGDGFLGAYTTFSTFMYEDFNLFQEKEKLNAFTYVLSTAILGILGFALGKLMADMI